jgi:hypothetical protein
MLKSCEKNRSVPVKLEVEIVILKIIGVPEKYNQIRLGLHRKRKRLTTSEFSPSTCQNSPEAKLLHRCTLYATKTDDQVILLLPNCFFRVSVT